MAPFESANPEQSLHVVDRYRQARIGEVRKPNCGEQREAACDTHRCSARSKAILCRPIGFPDPSAPLRRMPPHEQRTECAFGVDGVDVALQQSCISTLEPVRGQCPLSNRRDPCLPGCGASGTVTQALCARAERVAAAPVSPAAPLGRLTRSFNARPDGEV